MSWRPPFNCDQSLTAFSCLRTFQSSTPLTTVCSPKLTFYLRGCHRLPTRFSLSSLPKTFLLRTEHLNFTHGCLLSSFVGKSRNNHMKVVDMYLTHFSVALWLRKMADSRPVSAENRSQRYACSGAWGDLVALREYEVKQIRGEEDTITVRLSGNTSECQMSRWILMTKSGVFRAMLSSRFQVGAMRPLLLAFVVRRLILFAGGLIRHYRTPR